MPNQISIPAASLGLQGALNTIFGLYGILQPLNARSQMADQFGSAVPQPAATTISLQLIGLGIFTLLAANQRSLHRRALLARMAFHLMAGYLFWGQGSKMQTAAKLDYGFAVLNLGTLYFVA